MQTTRGRSEQERKESVEKSDQIQGTRGKVSCVAWAGILTESMRSLCGLHDPQDPGRAQLAPCSLFLAPRVSGRTPFLRPGAGNHRESTPPQVPPFEASPPVSEHCGMDRSTAGKRGSACCSRGITSSDPAEHAPVFGPREPLGNIGE